MSPLTFNESWRSTVFSDVDILQRCCGVFRNLFVENTGLETVHEDVYDSRGLQPGLQDEFPGTGHDRRHPIHRFI